MRELEFAFGLQINSARQLHLGRAIRVQTLFILLPRPHTVRSGSNPLQNFAQELKIAFRRHNGFSKPSHQVVFAFIPSFALDKLLV
jgi:hypothetical protein